MQKCIDKEKKSAREGLERIRGKCEGLEVHMLWQVTQSEKDVQRPGAEG